LKEVSKLFWELLSEAQINGREISTFKLKKPITYNDRSILCLELPAPKKGSAQKEWFDHVEFAIQGDLNEFMEKYASINFDTKWMGKNINPDISKKYDWCEVKFHQNTLEYVIKNEQA
jgi:predicted metalloenzyme YecM